MGDSDVKNSRRNSGVARGESLIGKKVGLEKGTHYPSSFSIPGLASWSRAELNLITSNDEYIVIVFTGHILYASYCSKALHTS